VGLPPERPQVTLILDLFLAKIRSETGRTPLTLHTPCRIMNLLRATLCSTALPTFLWCFLVEAIVLCLSLMPSGGLRVTREQACTGKRPNVAYLRAIGCGAYGRHRSQEDIAAGKQGTRASPGVLVGYDGPYKYILYHWTNRSFKVYRDQDVVMEQVFPFQLGRIPSLMPFSAKDLLNVRPPVAFDPGVFDPVLAAAQPLALATACGGLAPSCC